jgi:hypothetical protein
LPVSDLVSDSHGPTQGNAPQRQKRGFPQR